MAREKSAITLQWESANGSTYVVYSDMGTGLGAWIRKDQVNTSTYSDTGLLPGTQYAYGIAEKHGAENRSTETGSRWGEVIAVTRGESIRPAVSLHVAVPTEPPLSVAGTPTATPIGTALAVGTRIARGTPTAVSPRPISTPFPANVVVLSLMNVTDHQDEIDNIVIVGEIKNDSPHPATDADITVTFYNARGDTIRRERTKPLLSLLRPQQRSPFVLTVPRPENLWDWSVQAIAHSTMRSQRTGLIVTASKAHEDASGFYHVTGTVVNDGTRTISLAQVIVTLYDRRGRPINASFAYTDPYSIQPSQEASFDTSFSYYPQVKTHTVQLEWD